MGEVYCADDLKLNQAVALKFLPPAQDSDAAALDRLRQEPASRVYKGKPFAGVPPLPGRWRGVAGEGDRG
jgi:hypothetical protein